MKKYIVRIKLDNGDEVQSRVEAESQEKALDRLEEFFKTGAGDIGDVATFLDGRSAVGIEVVKAPDGDGTPDGQKDVPPTAKNPLEEYRDIHTFMQGGRWVAIDEATGLGFRFVQGKFEQTAETHIEPRRYKRDLEPWEVAASTRKVCDYLRTYRPELYSRNKNPYKYEIAKEFKDRRKRVGMTTEELAVRSGVFVDVIEKMEEGKIMMVKLSTLEAVAEAMGCHIHIIPDSQK